MKGENPAEPNTELCRRMLSPRNLVQAISNVKKNKGSAGVDGMEVYEIDGYMEDNWKRIEEQILARRYKPKPVKRVEIPKDNGGIRLLGVPCVIDRVIQQAMVQVLSPLFEPTFSDYSYGFRPGRSAEDAVRKAQEYMAEGYKHVVDLDLSKFFDTVNHDYLMSQVDRTLEDKDIRRLIYVYLKSGVMANGCMIETEEGTPQGGPLSPLLSNIYLTPYDKELEKRGHKFVRYADDCNIFTRSKYSCRRVKDSMVRFLEGKMKLKVNTEKTEARRAVGSSFLGFTFITTRSRDGLGMCKPKAKKAEKFEQKVKEITKRNRGVSAERMIKELNAYLARNVEEAMTFFKEKNLPLIPYRPEGSFLLWIDCRNAGIGTRNLDKFFLEKAHIHLDDGLDNFGPDGEGYVRINFAVTEKNLREALSRIEKAFSCK